MLVPIARLEHQNRLQEIPHHVQIALLVLINHPLVNHLVLRVLVVTLHLQLELELPRLAPFAMLVIQEL